MGDYKFDTVAVHGGQVPDPTTNSRAVPIYQTTSFVFDDVEHARSLFGLEQFGNIYTRIMNPTWDVLEQRVAALEGGAAAIVTASGQSATTLAILNLTNLGDEIVSSSSLYGGTYNLFHYTLPRLGVNIKFIDSSDPENFRKAITDKTKAFFVETIGNPRLDIPDFEKICAIAHEKGIPVIVDNTLASPAVCQPIKWGADIVTASLTKFIGGHGTSIGGIIVDSGKFNWKESGRFQQFTEPDPSYHGLNFWDAFGLHEKAVVPGIAYIIKLRVQLMRDIGPCLSPFNAFLFLQGAETLHVRMERHCQNAQKVAEWLQNHPDVTWINYPGLPNHPSYACAKKYLPSGSGAILGFGIKGGKEAGIKFIDAVELFSHLANVGDSKSLIIHPASTTHQQLSDAEQAEAGVTDDYIRLSVGIEDVNDIIADLEKGFAAAKS